MDNKAATSGTSNREVVLGCAGLLLGIALVIVACTGAAHLAHKNDVRATATAQGDAYVAATQTSAIATQTALAPTPTADHHAVDVAKQHVSLTSEVTAHFVGNFNDGVLDVTAVLGTAWDSNSAKENVKLTTMQIMESVWKSGMYLTKVTVAVEGPLVDKYGNSSTGAWGIATLTRETASKFNWANLDQDSTWDDYDTTWLIPQ